MQVLAVHRHDMQQALCQHRERMVSQEPRLDTAGAPEEAADEGGVPPAVAAQPPRRQRSRTEQHGTAAAASDPRAGAHSAAVRSAHAAAGPAGGVHPGRRGASHAAYRPAGSAEGGAPAGAWPAAAPSAAAGAPAAATHAASSDGGGLAGVQGAHAHPGTAAAAHAAAAPDGRAAARPASQQPHGAASLTRAAGASTIDGNAVAPGAPAVRERVARAGSAPRTAAGAPRHNRPPAMNTKVSEGTVEAAQAPNTSAATHGPGVAAAQGTSAHAAAAPAGTAPATRPAASAHGIDASTSRREAYEAAIAKFQASADALEARLSSRANAEDSGTGQAAGADPGQPEAAAATYAAGQQAQTVYGSPLWLLGPRPGRERQYMAASVYMDRGHLVVALCMFTERGGRWAPGKRGVTLTLVQFNGIAVSHKVCSACPPAASPLLRACITRASLGALVGLPVVTLRLGCRQQVECVLR